MSLAVDLMLREEWQVSEEVEALFSYGEIFSKNALNNSDLSMRTVDFTKGLRQRTPAKLLRILQAQGIPPNLPEISSNF